MLDYAKNQNDSHILQFSKKVVRTVTAKMMFWADVARQRHQLQSLTDEMLDDIGIDRIQARAEWERPFWDINDPQRRNLNSSGCTTANQFTSFRGNSLFGGRA